MPCSEKRALWSTRLSTCLSTTISTASGLGVEDHSAQETSGGTPQQLGAGRAHPPARRGSGAAYAKCIGKLTGSLPMKRGDAHFCRVTWAGKPGAVQGTGLIAESRWCPVFTSLSVAPFQHHPAWRRQAARLPQSIGFKKAVLRPRSSHPYAPRKWAATSTPVRKPTVESYCCCRSPGHHIISTKEKRKARTLLLRAG